MKEIDYEYKNMLIDVAEIAIERYRVEKGEIPSFIKKTEAWRLYGRTTIDRWLKEGLIKPKKDGNGTAMVRLDRIELELLSKSSNRHSYKSKNE